MQITLDVHSRTDTTVGFTLFLDRISTNVLELPPEQFDELWDLLALGSIAAPVPHSVVVTKDGKIEREMP